MMENINIIRLREIDSTNSEAKRRAQNGEKLPMLVVSDSQSAGRGRLGRSFYSPDGTGLYMSLAYKAECDMTEAVKITSAAAVAVCLAIEELSTVKPMIKWVNDVYVEGKKVCGILTEATKAGDSTVIVLGIGVNCKTEIFPDEIKNIAGSVGIDHADVLCEKIIGHVLRFISEDEFISEYRRRSLVLGREISYTENCVTKHGVAAQISDGGALILSDGTILNSGEITVRF